jgi:hypothetical protein
MGSVVAGLVSLILAVGLADAVELGWVIRKLSLCRGSGTAKVPAARSRHVC